MSQAIAPIVLSPRVSRVKLSPNAAAAARAAALAAEGRDIISLTTGEPDFDTPEAIKQAAIASAAECYVVIDQSKLGRFRPAFYSTLEVFSGIVVGGTPEQDQLDLFSDFPIEVVAG